MFQSIEGFLEFADKILLIILKKSLRLFISCISLPQVLREGCLHVHFFKLKVLLGNKIKYNTDGIMLD